MFVKSEVPLYACPERTPRSAGVYRERDFFINNLLVRIHSIIVMIK